MKAVAVAILLVAGVAAAAPRDYAPSSTEWNGLSRLVELARQSGCQLSVDDELDWSSLDGGDVLWFVYPRSAVDPQKLESWLASGGRAVIADDFGAAAPALERLGIHRGPAPASDVPRYHENPNLPIAVADGKYELGRAAPQLVSNHPSSFQTALPPTFAFSPGAALVVEGQLKGGGSFVAIADPSVFINNMLELDENRAFAQALVDKSCRGGRDRIRLYTQAFAARGEPPSHVVEPPEPGSGPARFNQSIERANQTVKSALADGTTSRVLAVMACALALTLLLGAFPTRHRLVDRWTRVPRLDASALDAAWDFGGSAAIVRDEAIERLQAALGASIDFDHLGPQALGQKVAARFGDEAGRRASELWRRLHQIRWRVVDGEIMPGEHVSRPRLERLHRLATAVFDDLQG